MFGRLWQWVEDSIYAALTRGTQRWVNDMSAPADDAGDRPVLRLTFHPVPAADAVAEKDGEAEAVAVGNGRRKTKAGG